MPVVVRASADLLAPPLPIGADFTELASSTTSAARALAAAERPLVLAAPAADAAALLPDAGLVSTGRVAAPLARAAGLPADLAIERDCPVDPAAAREASAPLAGGPAAAARLLALAAVVAERAGVRAVEVFLVVTDALDEAILPAEPALVGRSETAAG